MKPMNSYKNAAPQIQQCALFRNIPENEIWSLLNGFHAKLWQYEKNEIIFQEGERVENIGIVIRGSIFVAKEDYFGNRSILTVIFAPELFGEVFACAQTEVLPVSAVARESCLILLMQCNRILIEQKENNLYHSRLIHNLLSQTAQKNLLLNQKLNILSKRTTKEKLLSYLSSIAKKENSAAFTIPYNRQQLADYLGVERSALCAEISRLSRDGVLKTERSFFRLMP